MTIQNRLLELGLKLPAPSTPGGNYVSVNIRNDIAYIAIQVPKNGEHWIYKGRLGVELTTEDGHISFQ